MSRKTLASIKNMPAANKSLNNRRLCKRRINKIARRLDRAMIQG